VVANPRSGNRADGVRAGSVAGVPILVAPSWFLIAAVITILFAPAIGNELPGVGNWRYGVSFAFAVLLYASVLVHELGHTLTARAFGLPVRRITLHLLGGLSEIEQEPDSASKEFLVAAAGPVVSLGLAGAGYVSLQGLTPSTVAYVLLLEVTGANLLVGLFNLLPGLPLDGGRILRAAVWGITGRPSSGTVVAAWVGRLVAVAVIGAPLFFAWRSGYEPSFVGLVWSALIASFIWSGANAALRASKVRERLPLLTAQSLVRRAHAVRHDVPLAEALRQLAEVSAGALIVADGEGRPMGVVSEAAVVATPAARRPWVPVGDVSRRIEPGTTLPASLEGEALLRAIQEHPATEYLVVDADGRVTGVLTTADVQRVFAGV